MLTGTIVNTLAIAAGSAGGLLLRQLTNRLASPSSAGGLAERLQDIVMKGVALCVIYIGISGMLKGINPLISILSIVIGGILGEIFNLDGKMTSLGGWLQKKIGRLIRGDSGDNLARGFVSASLLFCVGAMAIVGSLQDGLTGNHATLFAKSLLDGISSVVFASSMGVGVLFSAVMVFLYQGSIAVLASLVSPLLSDTVVAEMTCVGSLLILALGLNMLGVTKIKVMNLVPACFLPILFCLFL